jgi:N4-gp56 family major capsid protein
MPNTFGFGSDTTGFSSTVHSNIVKKVIDTLRAGLVSLPKGAVIPADVRSGQGETFTIVSTEYPDLLDAATTNPLTEGVAPTALKLGVDVNSWTVAQTGAWTKVSDVARMQSGHNIETVAQDKIARLAAQTIDNLGLTAIAAHAIDRE